MMIEENKIYYETMFKEYPDVVNTNQAVEMLHTSKKNLYRLIKSHRLSGLKIGAGYKIPKVLIIDFLLSDRQTNNDNVIDNSSITR